MAEHLEPRLPQGVSVVTDSCAGGLWYACWVLEGQREVHVFLMYARDLRDAAGCMGAWPGMVAHALMARGARGGGR